MKFLLTIYGEESGWGDASPEEIGQVMAAYEAFGRAAAEAGVLVGGEGLQPTSTATTVRVRDNETLTTDGPFAETREQLGGYYLLDCSDLDDAIGWAARVPGAQNGSVEVRPVMNYEGSGSHVDEARERAQR
jgi:hypothetical protein